MQTVSFKVLLNLLEIYQGEVAILLIRNLTDIKFFIGLKAITYLQRKTLKSWYGGLVVFEKESAELDLLDQSYKIFK